MKNNNVVKFFLITFILFCMFPISVSAFTIKHSRKWTASTDKNGLGFDNKNYWTKGYVSNPRETKYLGGFRIKDETTTAKKDRVFCVEPGVYFPDSDEVTKYSITSKAPNINDGYHWNVDGDEEHLKKVLSCWTENTNSIVATQAIVWELVSEERDGINSTEILSGDYKPHMADKKTYGDGTDSNGSNIVTLYELIKGHTDLYDAYKSILRCAARFKVNPSFSKEDVATAKASPSKLKNYNAETGTFSRVYTITNTLEPNILKYYTVSSDNSNILINKTNNSITISTTAEISKENAAKITLKYTYKDNGTSKLNSYNGDYNGKYDKYSMTYFVRDDDKTYQALARGYTTKESYLYVYTGSKPTAPTPDLPTVPTPDLPTDEDDEPEEIPKYQLKINKKDSYGNPMSGINFNIYSDPTATVYVGTITTNSSGEAILTGIQNIGKYYAKEVDTPDGFVTNNQILEIDVKAENIEGTDSYAYASLINYPMIFTLYKKTIDAEGNTIDIIDYDGNNCTGNYRGPKFTINKENNDICVIPVDGKPGKYILADSCTATGATKEVKTCTGKFDIEGIKSGCYKINEITAPIKENGDSYQLPNNPSQTICVTKGQDATVTVMYNGVTGVLFNKITENGKLLDGGKYALQKRANGIYKDILLQHKSGAVYSYVKDLKEQDEKATYILETNNGTINVQNLPTGEYRFVEKQAPDGYDMIKEKDSNATFTISDKGIFGKDGNPVLDFYQVKLVNQKSRVKGSYDSAELIVTIITGRKVANYALIIAGLAVLLTLFIILRNKFKK